jgi:hypothetical protein
VSRVSKFWFLYFFGFILITFAFRRQHMTDPNLVKGINWTFSPKTGNSSLRSHLESVHKQEYLQLCQVNGWEIMLPKMRKAAETETGGAGGDSPPRPIFSQDQFLKSLVNFIVADDQVRPTPLQYSTPNNITCSQSISWSVPNFVTSFSCCGQTYRTRTFLTGRKFVRPSLPHGRHGSLA